MFNRQRKLSVESEELQDFLERLVVRLQLELGFAVVLVSNSAIRRYNLKFRFRDEVTDVLSFPTSAEDRRLDPFLGDVIISAERADEQKRGTLAEELQLLALHGTLHLLGYDHETDHGEMRRVELELRSEFNLPVDEVIQR